MAAEQDPLSRLAFAEEVIVSPAHAQTAPNEVSLLNYCYLCT